MAKINVGLPQGTRDFGPDVVRKRSFILQTIKNVFELYGFQPLETPAFENIETLMGKYGEEGDKLIFKILNNGLNDPKNADRSRVGFEQVMTGKSSKDISERALKYDLTIPFARYVAMNHGQLTLPFKRYQIQPVWRADRPQKGRYREFYQCDADVVGSKSLINEIELVAIYAQVFKTLKIPVEIRINSRKILAALAEICGGAEKLTDITVAIDKLDKKGLAEVEAELLGKGLDENQVSLIRQYIQISGTNLEKVNKLKEIFGDSEIGAAGIDELEFVMTYEKEVNSVILDLTLARGLNYYTGIILEIKPATVQLGSIGGGGRYDDLTGLFGVSGIPGVGISFGVDRIYDVMEELHLFPSDVFTGTQVLLFNLGDAEVKTAVHVARRLRQKNIRTEIYPDVVKMDKQFKYAEKKNIPFIIIIGENEIATQVCNVKDIRNGTQQTVPLAELDRFEFAF